MMIVHFLCATAHMLSSVQEPAYGAQLRAWRASAEGDFRGSRGNLEGTTIDLEDDLDLGGPEVIGEASGFLRLGKAGRLWGSYWGGKYEGQETLTRTVRFLALTYTVSTTVESEADLDVGSITYELPLSALVGFEEPAIELGILVSGKMAALEIDVQSDTQSASESYTAPFPTLGVRAAVRPWPWLYGEADAAFCAVSYGGVSVRYAEARAELRAIPWGPVSVGLGYRFVHADLNDDDDFEVDVALKGPFFVLAVTF